MIVCGNPIQLFPVLLQEWGVTKVYYEIDIEPLSVVRDANLSKTNGAATWHGIHGFDLVFN